MVAQEQMNEMLQNLQKMNADSMATIMATQSEAFARMLAQVVKPSGGMTDTRGIGRPISFKGEESKYTEWKAKLMAYFMISVPDATIWVNWAHEFGETITTGKMNAVNPQGAPQMADFSSKLYAILLSCTEEDPFRIVHSVKDGSGLEAMRLLMKRYEPRTPGTKRALLKTIINNPSCKNIEEIEIT